MSAQGVGFRRKYATLRCAAWQGGLRRGPRARAVRYWAPVQDDMILGVRSCAYRLGGHRSAPMKHCYRSRSAILVLTSAVDRGPPSSLRRSSPRLRRARSRRRKYKNIQGPHRCARPRSSMTRCSTSWRRRASPAPAATCATRPPECSRTISTRSDRSKRRDEIDPAGQDRERRRLRRADQLRHVPSGTESAGRTATARSR